MRFRNKLFILISILSFVFLVSACVGGSGSGNEGPGIGGETIEIIFVDRYVEYNGQMYQHEIDAKIPSDIYVRYEYIKLETGEFVSDKGVIEPGEYEVRVFFEGDIGKYGLPPDMVARLIIKGHGKPSEVWFDEQTFDYTGEFRSVYINGYLPGEIKVRYEYYLNGNEYIGDAGVCDPGDYLVYAFFEGPYEEYGLPERMETWLHIIGNNPGYDVEVTFDDIVWCPQRGGELNHKITGELPFDVWVEYEYNFPYEPGEYESIARFYGEYEKYGLPEVMTARITIFEEIFFEDQTFVYNGMTYEMRLDCYIPSDIHVEYIDNIHSEPGEYFVTARLSGALDKYGFMDKYHARMIIFNIEEVRFMDESYIYQEGKHYKIKVENLPPDISVRYEYHLNGEFISDRYVKEIGIYDVYAYLEGDFEKYGLPFQYYAKLEILPDEAHRIDVCFESKTVTYNGNTHYLELYTELPEDVSYEFINNGHIDVGSYDVTVIFSGNYRIYGIPETMEAQLTIEQLAINMSDITFNNQTFEYDGLAHSLYIESPYIDYLDVSYSYNERTNPGTNTVYAQVYPKDSWNVTLVGDNVLSAQLKINKMIYTVNEAAIQFNNTVVEYNGYDQYLTVDQFSLPEGLMVDFMTDNYHTDAGTYTVTVGLVLEESYRDIYTFVDGDIYYLYPQMTITKKAFELKFYQTEFVYDSFYKNLVVDQSNFPVGMEVRSIGTNSYCNAGEYDITFSIYTWETSKNYEIPSTYTAKLVIKPAQYPYDICLNHKTIYYDGNPHNLEFNSLPEGTQVIYSEKDIVDVGSYHITATLKNPNFIDKTYGATLTILESEIDLSNIKFGQLTYTYDGLSHSATVIDSSLPEDVYYEINMENSFTDVGTYWVTFTFYTTNQNYIPTTYDVCVVINKATVDMSNVIIENKVYTYDGSPKFYEYTGLLPEGIANVYYDNNVYTDAGEYTVTIHFQTLNDNYNPVSSKTAKLIINKAKFDMSNISFVDKEIEYDGNEQSIFVDGYVDPAITVSYTGNGKVNVGTYTVTVTFKHNLPNYLPIESITASLTIIPKHIELTMQDKEVTYNGNYQYIYLDDVPSNVTVNYENNGQINAGTYTVVAKIRSNNANYSYPTEVSATLKINKADIVISYPHQEYSYTGGTIAHRISAQYIPSTIEIVYDGYIQTRAGHYECTVSFVGEDPNYNTPKPISSSFDIVKIDRFDITMIVDGEVSYIYGVPRYHAAIDYLPKVPDKDQYIGRWDNPYQIIDGDITVYAIYDIIKYTIYIDTDGAYLDICTIDVPYNYEFELPELTRKDYTFAGYYYNGLPFESGLYPYKEDIEIVAKWIPDTYSINIKNSQGTIIETVEVNKNGKFTLPLTLTIDGNEIQMLKYYNGTTEYKPLVEYKFKNDSDLSLYYEEFDLELNSLFTFDFYKPGGYDKQVDEDSLIIKSYTGDLEELIIPSHGYYNDKYYPIVAIGYKAISSESLVSLVIPDQVIEIEYGALIGSNNIQSLTVPFIERGLGAFFFDGTSFYPMYYDTFEIPDTIETLIITGHHFYYQIDSYAFYNTNLKKVVSPEGLTNISSCAFEKCSLLEEVYIPSTVKEIKSQAFYECTNLKNVTLSDGLEVIGNSAFSNCQSLTSIEIPNTVNSIDSSAFSRCISIKTAVLSNTITYISSGMFYGNSSLESITIPSSVLHINNSAFYDCIVLKTVNISADSNLKTIEYEAFYRCYELANITIPSKVTYIGKSAFHSCRSLISITLPNTITEISNSVFSGCTNLTRVNIPTSLVTIGNFVFYQTKLSGSITLPNTLINIGSSVFSQTNVTSAIIPGHIKNIPNSLFSGCKELTSVTIGNGVETIGSHAFSGCYKLGNITLPSSLVDIGDYAFDNCREITSITIPSKVKHIGAQAFNYCLKLEEVVLPYGLLTIGYSAFERCEVLSKINLPNTIESIGATAFGGTIKLTSINWPSNLTTIESCMFSQGGLKSFNFTNITYIDSSAFYECELESITLPNSLTYIGDNAFQENNIKELYIPNNVEFIGYASFWNNPLEKVTLPFIGETSFNGYRETLNSIISSDLVTELTINGGIIYQDTFDYMPKLTKLTISNNIYFVEAGFEYDDENRLAKFPSLKYNEYENGYYLGNSSNNYLVYVKPIDASLSVSINPNTRFGTGVYDDILFLDNNVYYLPTDTNEHFIAVGIKDLTVKEVIINENTFYLGEDLFRYAVDLEKIVLPDSLKQIREDIFIYNHKLKELVLPYLASTPTCEKLYELADLHGGHYVGNKNYLNDLNKLTINSGIIGANAIMSVADRTRNLEVVIGSGVTEIADYAFKSAYNDYTSIKLTFAEDSSLTRIGNHAFESSDFSNFILPNSLVSIGDYAFSNMDRITTFTIPNSVTSIGVGLFKGCVKLETVIFEEGSLITSIPNETFYNYNGGNSGYSKLSTVILPEGIKEIGDFAFSGCEKIINFVFPTNLEKIGNDSFSYCRKLEVVDLLNTKLNSIGDNAFSYCFNLKQVLIPSTVTHIGDFAFYDCYCITEYTFEDGSLLESIGMAAISNNSALESIKLPSGLKSIGERAFEYTPLTSISLPDSVTYIGEYAFMNTSIHEFTVPKNINTYDITWINGNIETLKLHENVSLVINSDVFTSFKVKNLYLYPNLSNPNDLLKFFRYHQSKLFYYGNVGEFLKIDTPKSEYFSSYFMNEEGVAYQPTEIVVPLGITKIDDYKFYGFTNLTSVTLSEDVVEIGDYAFYNCSSLSNIIWPNKMDRIGKYAFYNCDKITKLELPSVTLIDDYAFYWSNGISEITFKEGLITIGDYAFEGAKNITKLHLPEGFESIGDYVFNDSYEITELILPSTIKYIGDNSFSINNNWTKIYNSCYNGTVLDWLNVELKGYNSFGNYKLFFLDENGEYYSSETIVIPEGVTKINSLQFYSLDINDLYLPSTIETIYSTGYYHLNNLHFNGTIDEWYNVKFVYETQKLNVFIVPAYNYLYLLDEDGNEYLYNGEIVIPQRITDVTIGHFTRYSSDINALVLHSNIRSIDAGSIPQTVQHIYYDGSIEDWFNVEMYVTEVTPGYDAHFYVRNSDGDYEEVKAVSVPDHITSVNPYQFVGMTYIKKFYLHDNVLKIGKNAIPTSVKQLELSTSLERLESGLNHLEYMIVPITVKYLESIESEFYYMGDPEYFKENVKMPSSHYGVSIYYYSEELPTDTTHIYWHFDSDGKPVKW